MIKKPRQNVFRYVVMFVKQIYIYYKLKTVKQKTSVDSYATKIKSIQLHDSIVMALP